MIKQKWIVAIMLGVASFFVMSLELAAAPGGGASTPFCQADQSDCIDNPCNGYEVCFDYITMGRFVENETPAGGEAINERFIVAGEGDDNYDNTYTVSGRAGESGAEGGDGAGAFNGTSRLYFHSETGPDFACSAHFMDNSHPPDGQNIDVSDCVCRDPSY